MTTRNSWIRLRALTNRGRLIIASQLLLIAAISATLIATDADSDGSADRRGPRPAESKASETTHGCDIPAYPQFAQVATWTTTKHQGATVNLCKHDGPCQKGYPLYQDVPTPKCKAQPYGMWGVDCGNGDCCCGDGREATWGDADYINFSSYGQGEYVGPSRYAHVSSYRLRVDDELEFVYVLTRNESSGPYRLEVGDEIMVESLTDEKIDRELLILPDGTISLPFIDQVKAAGRTLDELSAELEKRYKQYYKVPAITVTALRVNTRLQDLRDAVDARAGTGGQSRIARITPEGTIQLPIVGSVPAQGLTLDELKREIDQRYECLRPGITVDPVLTARAPRFVYVLGEVVTPGRYELNGPTSAMQAIALAEGWNNGGNLREIVVFRRGEDWRLMATRLDLRGALIGKRPCPADEIWLRDADIVVVPKSPILLADDFIELVFTRGIYGVVPFQGVTINMARLKSL